MYGNIKHDIRIINQTAYSYIFHSPFDIFMTNVKKLPIIVITFPMVISKEDLLTE